SAVPAAPDLAGILALIRLTQRPQRPVATSARRQRPPRERGDRVKATYVRFWPKADIGLANCMYAPCALCRSGILVRHAGRIRWGGEGETEGRPMGGTNETTSISNCNGCRRRRYRDSRSGDCSVVADFKMATYSQLAEIARYLVWNLRTVRQICVGSNRRQIPDPVVHCRREPAAFASARRGAERHCR